MEEAHKEALSKLEVAHKNELREYDRHSKIEVCTLYCIDRVYVQVDMWRQHLCTCVMTSWYKCMYLFVQCF